jgi:excisionase family DNA binding protein
VTSTSPGNDDEIIVSGAQYWVEDPAGLAEALHELGGIDIGTSRHLLHDAARLARAPIEILRNTLLRPFPTSTRPIPSTPRLTLSVEEAADALGISRALAYEAVKNGQIPHIRIGKRILVPKAALDRLLGAGD